MSSTRPHLRVLSIEDDPEFSVLLRRVLEKEGFGVRLERVQTSSDLEAALDRQAWDVVLSDHSMPDFSSQQALQIINARGLDLPFLVVSGQIGEEAAVSVMRAGAHDYVPKANLGRLGVSVERALREASERATLHRRERDLEALHAVAFAAGKELDARRLADFAISRARDLLGADTAALYWWNPSAGVLERVARSLSSTDAGIERIAPGDGAAGIAFARRETVVVDDYATWPHRLPGSTEINLRSAVGTPLFIGDRVTGAMVIGSLTPRHFLPEEIRVLSVLAAEVAPAIQTGQLLAAAQHAAHYDGLTGLPNRALFTGSLAQQVTVCRESNQSFALLYVDLDEFRQINDAFGHEAGNTVLRELGIRLAQVSDSGAWVGRLGADEFVVLLPPGSDLAEGEHAAQTAIELLKRPFAVEGHSVHLSASLGLVAFPEHGTEADQLLHRAESAMFAAKRSQTRYRRYATELDPQSQRRIALDSELRRALQHSEFLLHYQPQVDCRSGALIGGEALVRWQHPQRGLIPPMEFIPFAEQSGLIVEITPWVVREALHQVHLWRQQAFDVRVSVNVAMRNLHDPGFFDEIRAVVDGSGVSSSHLTLEITEGTVMLEAERTLELLRKFRTMGIGVALDDFGTGYSSLSYLSQLPVDEIKIDKSFVMALDDPRNHAIVAAVIELGRAFGLRVVAEGVKDAPTYAAITALNCPLAQGFFFGAPMSAASFRQWALERATPRSGQ